MSTIGFANGAAVSEKCLQYNVEAMPRRSGHGEIRYVDEQDVDVAAQHTTVIIDRRLLLGQCLLTSLRLIDKHSRFELFSDIEFWHRHRPFVPASVILLCRTGGEPPNVELVQIAQELALLQGEGKPPPVVVMADGENIEQIARTINLGVRGYIPATVSPDIASKALQLVSAGGVYVPAEKFLPFLSTVKASQTVDDNEDEIFSPRQRSVARALRKGTPNKIIAYELNMCESTVKVHVRNIMKKLKAKNRTEVAYLTNKYFCQEEVQ